MKVAPDEDAIARAIASVPGVAAAEIVRPADGGRSRLMLRLLAGEDEQRVSWAVAATLRERFDIELDPDAIRQRTRPAEPQHDDLAVIHEADPSPDPTSDRVAERSADQRDQREDPSTTTTDYDTSPGDRTSPGAPASPPPSPAASPRATLWTARAPLAGPDDAPDPVHRGEDPATDRPEPTPRSHASEPAGRRRPIELATTRERLSRAVEDALAAMGEPVDEAGPDQAPDDLVVLDDVSPAAGLQVAGGDVAEPGSVALDDAGSGNAADDAEPGSVALDDAGSGTAPDAALEPDAAPVAAASVDDAPAAASRPVPPPPTSDAPAAEPLTATRASIEGIDLHRAGGALEVIVSLGHAGRVAAGRARAADTAKARRRAAAEATVAALDQLARAALVVSVDRIVVTDSGEDEAVSIVMTLVEHGAEQRLLGGALVRDDQDVDGAVVRATLDALNRRVTPLLSGA
ncbi:MAG: hypothetical protein JJT89_09470 [Nitriliruptoraceae bacterium]|nr:hypothetical protein [Nitriliruptoraceae bacterium]